MQKIQILIAVILFFTAQPCFSKDCSDSLIEGVSLRFEQGVTAYLHELDHVTVIEFHPVNTRGEKARVQSVVSLEWQGFLRSRGLKSNRSPNPYGEPDATSVSLDSFMHAPAEILKDFHSYLKERSQQ